MTFIVIEEDEDSIISNKAPLKEKVFDSPDYLFLYFYRWV